MFNITILSHYLSEKVRLHETVLTSDDLVYIKPVVNFVAGKGWTDGSIGRQQYFSRPPGYSLFFLPFYVLFGLKKGLLFLKFTQLFLFSLSSVCFLKILDKWKANAVFSFIASCIYGVFPIASGFVFYTLTEAITPALLLFSIYFLQKANKNGINTTRNLLKAVLLMAILLLIRPVFLFYLLSLLVIIFRMHQDFISIKKRMQRAFLYGLLAIFPLLCWEIRVVSICKEFPGLYPVYDKEVNTIYRPTHRAIWEFGKCWGISGKEFHEHIGPVWEQVIYPDSIQGDPVGEFIATIPQNVVVELGEKSIRKAFESYQETVAYQRVFYLKKHKLPSDYSLKEQQAVQLFTTLTQQYISNHWMNYYVYVPFIYLKEMSFHSNLNLYVFQHTWRGNFVMETTRFFSLLIHFSSFILLFLSLFLRNISFISRLLSFSTICYVLFLAFYFRELEERYTLPILPIMLLISFDFIIHSKCYVYVKSKFKKG
jgi:hypothetical protein